jgi:excisionase family DNA binding protein
MSLTVKQAAEHAAISESLIYAWCKAGVLSHTRLGRPGKRGTIRIDKDELEKFLQTMKVVEVPQEDSSPLEFIK